MRATRWGGRQVKKGVDVWRGTMVGKVIDHNLLEARLRLPERYVDSVKVGNQVTIYSLQTSNKIVKGRIKRIDNVASLMNPRNRKSLKYHWAYLNIDSNTLHEFQPGETLIAKIQLAYYQNCWVIPKELTKIQRDTLILNTTGGQKSFTNFSTSEDYFLVKSHNHKDTIGETLSIFPNF